MQRRAWAFVVLAALRSSPLWAQGPAPGEFQVNTFTTGYQSYPSVATYDSGFVVAWDSADEDGNGRGVFARRYDFNGVPDPPIPVNQYTTSWQWRADAAADVNGGFVVTWQSHGQDGSDYGVFARRFDGFGPLGDEFQVNTYTTGRQRFPAVAMDPVGRFVIVWTGLAADGSYDIFGRAYNQFGTPLGDEFRVPASTTAFEVRADVAMDGSGGFVVAWDGYDADFSGVFARRFGPGAVALGGDLAVNVYTTDDQYAPAVAVDGAGNFVVTFIGQDADREGVFARRFTSAGTPAGNEFQVNTTTAGGHERPLAVDFDAAGNFVVAWSANAAGYYDVMARAFDAAGAPRTGEFRVNAHAPDDQSAPALAFDGPDHFQAVWMSRGQDGDGWGVFGRRLDPDRIFADGFESGNLSAWSSSSGDGGDLTVSPFAAMRGSFQGLSGLVDDLAALYVQDDSPHDESQYRARFYLDPNGFDPGETSGARRTRVFILFEESPLRRLAAVVLRRVNGTYGIMLRTRLDDNSQYDTGFFTISDDPHFVELAWKRSSGPDANDGSVELWIDGVSRHLATTLDNSRSAVDFVRLGALSVKLTASGALRWDEFDSRRITSIGP